VVCVFVSLLISTLFSLLLPSVHVLISEEDDLVRIFVTVLLTKYYETLQIKENELGWVDHETVMRQMKDSCKLRQLGLRSGSGNADRENSMRFQLVSTSSL